MPTIAIIGNIRIMIHSSDHPPPHVHLYAPDFSSPIVVDVETTNIMRGRIADIRKAGDALDWIDAHRDDILAQWRDLHGPA